MISVLIPVYNCEKYLAQCLESVINQTYKDIEIIIINDGSTDNSIKIINEFIKKDKRIKLINKSNSGYGNSLNIAIKKAKGDYISIIEPDDYIKENMFEILRSYKDYDMVKSSFYFKKHEQLSEYKKIHFTSTNINKNPEILLLKPSIWSAIYKKDFILNNNIFFNETQGAAFQDTSFHFKTYYCAKTVKFIDTPLYVYRQDNQNSSINACDKVFEICLEFESINKFLENKNTNGDLYAYKLLFELRAYIWNYKRIKNKYNNSFIAKISDIMKNYDISQFINNNKIPFKEKYKLYLLIHYKKLFGLLLYIVKNITI